MKTLKITVSLILFTTTFLHYSVADEQLIESTCQRTPIPQLCVATLKADPGSASADIRGIALILVGAVKAKTNEAIAAINRLKGGAPPKLSVALNHCTEVYNAVLVGDVPEAEQGLKLGNPKFAENGMADASVEAEDCEDAAGTAVGKPSPLSGVNNAVRDLGYVARAVIRNLL